MTRRGFSLVEMVLVLSVLLVVVPLVYRRIAQHSDEAAHQRWQFEVAESTRTIAEWLAADRAAQAHGGLGACSPRYVVGGAQVLTRDVSDACGGALALARQVESFEPVAGGVVVTFVRPVRPDEAARVEVFVPGTVPGVGTP